MNTGLNPCCSGRWSRTWLQKATSSIQLLVLILVVVEDGLVLVDSVVPFDWINRLTKVLILVVVEDGLVPVLWRFAKYQWEQS